MTVFASPGQVSTPECFGGSARNRFLDLSISISTLSPEALGRLSYQKILALPEIT